MAFESYSGYEIHYYEENGKIVVTSAFYCGLKCSNGKTFDSWNDLESYIDDGGWSAGSR